MEILSAIFFIVLAALAFFWQKQAEKYQKKYSQLLKDAEVLAEACKVERKRADFFKSGKGVDSEEYEEMIVSFIEFCNLTNAEIPEFAKNQFEEIRIRKGLREYQS